MRSWLYQTVRIWNWSCCELNSKGFVIIQHSRSLNKKRILQYFRYYFRFSLNIWIDWYFDKLKSASKNKSKPFDHPPRVYPDVLFYFVLQISDYRRLLGGFSLFFRLMCRIKPAGSLMVRSFFAATQRFVTYDTVKPLTAPNLMWMSKHWFLLFVTLYFSPRLFSQEWHRSLFSWRRLRKYLMNAVSTAEQSTPPFSDPIITYILNKLTLLFTNINRLVYEYI